MLYFHSYLPDRLVWYSVKLMTLSAVPVLLTTSRTTGSPASCDGSVDVLLVTNTQVICGGVATRGDCIAAGKLPGSGACTDAFLRASFEETFTGTLSKER